MKKPSLIKIPPPATAGGGSFTVPAAGTSIWLRWLANYGLSLSGAVYAVPGPEERESACPFAQLLKPQQRSV